MYLSDIVAALTNKGICAGNYKLVAECDEEGNSGLAAQIEKLKPTEAAGILKMFEMAVLHGPRNIPRNMRHEIDKNCGIYEFIKGNHRIPFFYDDGNFVVCSHMFRKKRQKTPPAELSQA